MSLVRVLRFEMADDLRLFFIKSLGHLQLLEVMVEDGFEVVDRGCLVEQPEFVVEAVGHSALALP